MRIPIRYKNTFSRALSAIVSPPARTITSTQGNILTFLSNCEQYACVQLLNVPVAGKPCLGRHHAKFISLFRWTIIPEMVIHPAELYR